MANIYASGANDPVEDCPACEAATARTPEGLSRRAFLQSGALALVGVALSPSFLTRTAYAAGGGGRKIVVAVFQRGAVDGLNMVIPFRETEYYRVRKATAVPAPRGGGGEVAIDLDGTFALHPALAPFKPLYDRGQLAIVHASGSPDSTRSHFDAQDYMESGAPGHKGVSDGWLNRLLGARKAGSHSAFRAVSISANLPRSLLGAQPALAIANLRAFGVRGGGTAMAHGFEGMYADAASDVLRGTGRESFEAVEQLHRKVAAGAYRPANGAVYPGGAFGRQLQQVAELIKADLGLEVACTEIGGWDTHANQGGARGQLANHLRELSGAIAAFCQDMGDRMGDIVIVTMSEFGRKLEENGSGGTDHGHGNCNFVIGGGVRGGRVYGRWPGLARERLFEGRDLAVTTDFRDVFAEIAVRHMRVASSSRIFPGYDIAAHRFTGFLAG
jgi:uncharacterized protein (DUF1501 family)